MTTGSPIWTPARHPLARLLREAAAGNTPAADGSWIRVTPWSPDVHAVLCVAGHIVLAVPYDVPDARLADLGVDRGGAFHPRVVTDLAGPTGWIGGLDVLLLSAGRGAQPGAEPLVSRPDLGQTHATDNARRGRQGVQVMGRRDAGRADAVLLSHGMAGVRQIDVALEPGSAPRGPALRDLVGRGLHCVPEGELVAASVPPADAAGLRAFLDSGFEPVGAVHLFSSRPERRT